MKTVEEIESADSYFRRNYPGAYKALAKWIEENPDEDDDIACWSDEEVYKVMESYAKTHAIEYAKYTCNEEDISEQRNREWADDYTEWINQLK